ncbi:MarR family transcriptional regulator [uncultured Sulfitobacter sp.]|uniref:MarR family winged helix-turn-helix transcriptional regulator n=1 Tax=uncultured Sulfitobacter sp. TaxID=191468 RepID=UPI00262A982C|nr:MarR family transcriptional regulator [uncultured Sulfitobacter sp.]
MNDDQITPELMLCFGVYRLQHAFGALYKPLLAPLGLTYAQYLVMTVLWDGGQLSVGQIGARLELESSTLTPLIKRLERAGHVTRKRDVDDERRVLIGLTEQGETLRARAQGIPDCIHAATGLDADAINALRSKLGDLHAAVARAAAETDISG